MFNLTQLFQLGTERGITIIGSVILCFSMACAPVVKNPTPLPPQAIQAGPHIEQEYRIQVGDHLDIKFFYNSELNEQVTVRPEGRISLQLVHEIMTAGF